ncbi:hypothetical protein AX17_002309 [Amanita inopinata Kibby_2008]|nr:hypothetical protein AX17_002309 [Amanita inopinata Kibby_2008]
MVHLRLNETESNPNPHVNFIAALPALHTEDKEAARQLLRALGAQVRPVMKSHGFAVNSFEEYEHNKVFAGRNWNNGETVELVLRKQDGSFLPTFWLMSTLCHELAHIKASKLSLNSGSSTILTLAAYEPWACFSGPLEATPHRSYWSSGQRLADSARIAGDGIEAGDLPEFMCGGAQSRVRPSSLRRRRPTQPTSTSLLKPVNENDSEEDSDDGYISIHETDADRRQTLLSSGEPNSDLQGLQLNKSKLWKDFQNEFNFSVKPIHISDIGCDIPIPSGSTFVSKTEPSTEMWEKPRNRLEDERTSSTSASGTLQPSKPTADKRKKLIDTSSSKLVQTQIGFRRKEGPELALSEDDDDIIISGPYPLNEPAPHHSRDSRQATTDGTETPWACLVCTLISRLFCVWNDEGRKYLEAIIT